jgi:glycosyltransferase involved in cell wall biosynthesis
MPVRVLCVGNMYPPHHLGGYELVWRSAVAHLRARGHEVRVLTTDFRLPGAAPEDEPDVHRELRWWWRDHAFPQRGLRARLEHERHNAAVFERHVAEQRPDLVAWWAMGGMSLSLISRAGRAGLPSVAFVHDDWLLYGPVVDQWTRMFSRRPRLGRAVERRTGIPAAFEPRHVGRWLFVSEFVRRRALETGLALGETGIAHSGIDPGYVGPAPERDWGWRLLYVGRIDERKGADVAVSALAQLPREATLTVVGDGDESHMRELRAQLAGAGLDGRVRLEPGRSRAALRDVYDEHDAVLFPARWDEPWGLVALEAMARGRPVVATGTGGSAEYLRDGENALLVPRDDPGALAAAVRRLADDRGLRARLREGGVPTASAHTEERFNAAVAVAVEARGD